MRRRAAGFAAAGVFLWMGCAAAAASSLPDKDEAWIKVTTAHFVLFSNASDQTTAEIGLDLERFRAALAHLLTGLETRSPLPTFIYVFKHDASFRPYKKRVGNAPANISGAFAAHRDGNYVGINATPENDPWSLIYHEYVHYFLNNNFARIPLWFNEGTAECFSTFLAAAGRAQIGRPIPEHVRHLKSGKWIPLSELFAIDVDSKDYNEGERQGTFYAESWALVQYLAWGRAGAEAHGLDFFARLEPRENLETALKTIVSRAGGDLEARVVSYVRRGKFTTSVLDLAEVKVEAPGAPVPMRYAETLSRLGDYLLRSQSGRENDAQAHFQAAILADPSHAPAYAGMGYVRDMQKRPQDAAGYYEKALQLDPGDGLAPLLYAESIMDRFSPLSGSTPAELARARDLYRRSIRLRPELAEAYAGLGATFAYDDQDLSEGIRALEKVLSMLPSRQDVVVNLAGLYARSGEESKARRLVDGVLAGSGNREAIETGKEILLQVDLKEAERLINTGDLDAGVSRLEEVRSKTHDARLRQRLGEELARIKQTQAFNGQIETYNRAVVLANQGEYRKAAAILERLAAEVQDPGLAKEAQALLERLRRTIDAEDPH